MRRHELDCMGKMETSVALLNLQLEQVQPGCGNISVRTKQTKCRTLFTVTVQYWDYKGSLVS